MTDESSDAQSPSLIAASIGDGVSLACREADAPGCVVGTFSNGFYVQAKGALFAVGGPDIPHGPLHLILSSPPPTVAEQACVWFDADRIRTNSTLSIDLRSAEPYRPVPPTPEKLITLAPTLATLDEWRAPPADVSSIWVEVRDAINRADLHDAKKLLEGRGRGLTPTGDDILAGILLFVRWLAPDSSETTDVARSTQTSELSRRFLQWAAIGQSIRPLHDVVDAASEIATAESLDDMVVANERFQQSIDVVAAIGGSSGRGILAGLGLAAALWPKGRLSK